MAKLVELNVQSIAKVGIPVPVNVNFNLGLLEQEAEVQWAGLRLYLNRPCKKNILVSMTEIFSKGLFENTNYHRIKNLNLTRRMIPTINESDIVYSVHGSLSFLSERGEEDNHDDEKIVILPTYREKRNSNPIKIELQGITLNINKDTYKEGEEISIKYSLDNFKNIEINLIQESKVYCKCEDYKTCVYIKPDKDKRVTISSNSVKNPLSTGSISIELPNKLEPSQDWSWDDVTRSRILHLLKYTNNYYLEINATNNNDEIIKFQSPIIIVKEEEKKDDFFSPTVSEPLRRIISPDLISVVDKKIENNQTLFTLKNESKTNMEGVTVKLTGIKEMFFELPPLMIGKKSWKTGENITISIDETTSNIEYQVLIEDNNGIEIVKKI
ncbi:MAG: hypothetical protein ACTSVY_07840 [Candidatus Helarchaeota archaeon]